MSQVNEVWGVGGVGETSEGSVVAKSLLVPYRQVRRRGTFAWGDEAMRSIPTACWAGSFCRRLRSARSVASQNRSTAEQPINTNGTRYCPRGAAGMLSAAASRPTLNRLGLDDSSNSANPASQQRRGYTSLLHQDGERRRQSRNAETRNGFKWHLRDTQTARYGHEGDHV